MATLEDVVREELKREHWHSVFSHSSFTTNNILQLDNKRGTIVDVFV